MIFFEYKGEIFLSKRNSNILKDLIKILEMGLIMSVPLENDANSK